MIKKIIIPIIFLILIPAISPIALASDFKEESEFSNMTLCHIKIQGEGEILTIGPHFVLGIGTSTYFKVELESGTVEIKNLIDSSDIVLLDGSQNIRIFGFFGYFNSQIKINGFALLTTW
jgi:hypothetical protein